jgi:hypothetical protein
MISILAGISKTVLDIPKAKLEAAVSIGLAVRKSCRSYEGLQATIRLLLSKTLVFER